MKFLPFQYLALEWNRVMFASRSLIQPIHDHSLAIVLEKEAKARQCFLRLLRSHVSDGKRDLLSCATSS
jgi:hypothetical protein